MPGSAKTGKQRSHSGAKKRARKTGTGKIRIQKAAHNHRLYPKNKRQKNLGGQLLVASPGEAKKLKVLLNN